MYCCCRPRLTSLFPKKARQQVDLPREDSQRKHPFFFSFFFYFFFFLFPPGSLGWSRLFFLGGGGGGAGEVGVPW